MLEFGIFDMCSVFLLFCVLFVCCAWLLVKTFVVSNVFLMVPKTESDFRCTEKAEFTVNSR